MPEITHDHPHQQSHAGHFPLPLNLRDRLCAKLYVSQNANSDLKKTVELRPLPDKLKWRRAPQDRRQYLLCHTHRPSSPTDRNLARSSPSSYPLFSTHESRPRTAVLQPATQLHSVLPLCHCNPLFLPDIDLSTVPPTAPSTHSKSQELTNSIRHMDRHGVNGLAKGPVVMMFLSQGKNGC